MKKILIPFEHPYLEDVERLCKVLYDRGYQCSPEAAATMWADYSDSMAASWMSMSGDSDDHVFGCVQGDVMRYAQDV